MKPEKGPKKAAKELDSDDERLIEKRRLGSSPLNTTTDNHSPKSLVLF